MIFIHFGRRWAGGGPGSAGVGTPARADLPSIRRPPGASLSSRVVRLAPDVILTATRPATLALQQATRSIPIVFAMVLDPVGSGIVESLARPEGNTTGFMQFEFSLSGKWVELLT
jgi:ABC transporter substrate binding protein